MDGTYEKTGGWKDGRIVTMTGWGVDKMDTAMNGWVVKWMD